HRVAPGADQDGAAAKPGHVIERRLQGTVVVAADVAGVDADAEGRTGGRLGRRRRLEGPSEDAGRARQQRDRQGPGPVSLGRHGGSPVFVVVSIRIDYGVLVGYWTCGRTAPENPVAAPGVGRSPRSRFRTARRWVGRAGHWC